MGRSGNVDAILERWLLGRFLGIARKIVGRGEWNSGKRCIRMASVAGKWIIMLKRVCMVGRIRAG